MFKWLRSVWVRFKGGAEQSADEIVSSSPDAIKAVYASAINEAKQTKTEMEQALGLLFQQRNRVILAIAQQEQAEKDTADKLQGAVTMSIKEADNPIHKQAGAKYLVQRQTFENKAEESKAELGRLDGMINEYKVRINQAGDRVIELGKEKAVALTEFTVAKNTLRLKEQLQGLSAGHGTATDEALVAVRDKIGALKAEVMAAQEMGALLPPGTTRDVYAEIGAEQNAAAEFEKLVARQSQVVELKPVKPVGYLEEEKEKEQKGG